MDDIKDSLGKINDKCSYFQELLVNCFGFTVTIAVSSEGRNYAASRKHRNA